MPVGKIFILLLAWAIILIAGTMNKRFHPDEALYTTFARNAFVHGDWLLTSPLDKPPISIYANAIAQALFGGVMTDKGVYDLPIRVGEFVAKIPNLFAGIITIAIFIALEKKLFPNQFTIGALCLIASPLFIGLSASAFTDSLMLMWVMGAWLAIERRQSFLSGLLLMVGFATKPQAIFFLPLLILREISLAHTTNQQILAPSRLMLVSNTSPPPSPLPTLWRGGENRHFRGEKSLLHAMGRGFRGGDKLKNGLRFGMGMVIPLVSLLVWDASRGTTSIFALGQYNYPLHEGIFIQDGIFNLTYRGFLAIMWTDDFVHSMNPIILLLTVMMIFIRAFLIIPISSLIHRIPRLKTTNLSQILWGFSIFYVLIHIIIGFPIYDRYILLIIPPIAIIIRRHIGFLAILGVIGVLVLLTSNFFARIGRDNYPVDEDGAIITLAEEINALPFGAIVYDHWRGWELGYYLGAWSDKRRVYYPDPYIQAEDSLNNPETATRFMVAPINSPYAEWVSAMQSVGYQVSIYKEIESYLIFALTPPPR